MSDSEQKTSGLKQLARRIDADEDKLRLGGGDEAIQRQKAKGRLFVRERIEKLIDPGTPFLNLACGRRGRCTRVGRGTGGRRRLRHRQIDGRRHMIIANDATVKAGAFFPATAKKVLRAQRIAMQNRLPLVYLVDSAGVFLPLQEDVFPDEDDFGRIFRNNAVISAVGLGQIAAIMGNCVAGGGYLPVLCDKLLMTDGSGLYLAGPALVKSAIGQEVAAKNWAEQDARPGQRHDRLSRPDRRSLPDVHPAFDDCRSSGSAGSQSPISRQESADPARPAEDVYGKR